MNTRHIKIGAIAVVLMFCLTVAAVAIPSEESEGGSDSVKYGFYVQFVDKDKNFVSKQWYSSEQPNKSFESFKNAYAVLAQHGINTTVTSTSYVAFTYPVIDGVEYWCSVLYASGNEWKVSDGSTAVYGNNTVFAITFFDESLYDNSTWAAPPVTITKADYDKLSADEKAKYVADDYNGYLLPGVSTTIGSTDRSIGTTGDVTYHFFVKFVDKNKNTISEQWYSAGEKTKSLNSCIDAYKILSKYGIDTKMVNKGSFISISNVTVGTQTYYCDVLYASGSEWKTIADTVEVYGAADTLSLTFYDSELYNSSTYVAEPVTITKLAYDNLSADEKAKYVADDYNGHLLPGVSTTGYQTPASSDNTALIIGIVVAVIVIIAIVAFVVVKKKQA